LLKENTSIVYIIIGLTVIFILFIALIAFAKFLNGFFIKTKYINNEIKRSTGIEKSYWIRQKRRIWLSLIPFVKY